MFVDASAMVAILAGETDANSLAARLGQAGQAITSPIAVYEAALGLARTRRLPIETARQLIEALIDEAAIGMMPITEDVGRLATTAFERYGKGRHRAALNLGDCFAYACARHLDMPMLFKGDDFTHTDVTVA
ncbi:MAG: type II toxin-antitoxin system VapC family toxin [Sphingomonadales bacterium]